MKRNAWTSLLALTIAALFLFSACTGGEVTPTNPPVSAETQAPAAEKTEEPAAVEPAEPTKEVAAGEVLIRTSFTAGEFTDAIIETWESEHPNIKVERSTLDDTKLMAMIAAGTAPDIIRVLGAQKLPMFVTRGLAMDLQDRVEASALIDESDLLPVCDIFRWDGKKTGAGPLYGLPKDWSLDQTIFVNKKAFEAKGVALPSETTPLTYDEFVALSKQLYVEEGGQAKMFGSGGWELGFNLMGIQALMAQKGLSIWSEDYLTVNLDNDDVRQIFNFIYDNVMSKAMASPINPNSGDYPAMFRDGQLAVFQVGYWFSGSIRGFNMAEDSSSMAITQEDVISLPALKIDASAKRISPCTSATGGIILKQTEHPEEAWQVFEWFLAGQPAKDRAMGGWGMPAYRSMMELLPQETDFDKQCYRVLMDEIDNSEQVFVQMNPYVNPDAVGSLITKYIEPIYFGESTIDEALPQLERDIQQLIVEGAEIAGVL